MSRSRFEVRGSRHDSRSALCFPLSDLQGAGLQRDSGFQDSYAKSEVQDLKYETKASNQVTDTGHRILSLTPIAVLGTAFLTFFPARTVYAAGLTLDLGNTAGQQMSMSLQILLLLTVLSIAPAILILMTSFTRIVIVLSFVRNALGTQQLPPNQVLIGLSLFLTFFVMAPTWNQINAQALQPYLQNQISQSEALSRAEEPLRTFMFKQTREKDLQLFVSLAKMPQPKTYGDIPTYVLIPSFIISELKTAFQMGFAIFIPFMVIDMIVSSTLMSMGMMMLPPMMISLPFKLLLFVLVDGWHLVVQSLVTSFH